MAWNFGNILDTIVPVLPEGHLALVHGDREIHGLVRCRSNLGRFMLDNGASLGTKSVFTCATGLNIWRHWRMFSRAADSRECELPLCCRWAAR